MDFDEFDTACMMAVAGDIDSGDSGKDAPVLHAFPGEDALQHLAMEWKRDSELKLNSVDLLGAANGQEPPAVRYFRQVPLDNYPPLDPLVHSPRDCERRREKRLDIVESNSRNAEKCYQIEMRARTKVFYCVHESVKRTSKMLADEIYAMCNLQQTAGLHDPYFDGPLAWRTAVKSLFRATRTKGDKTFYRRAEEIQVEHHLPDGCSAEDYSKKAMAFITHINPNLARPYTPTDAADYLIDMMPTGLREGGRRIRAEMLASGQLTELSVVARHCRTLVAEEQKAKAQSPTLLAAGSVEAHLSMDLLSMAAGMTLVMRGRGGGGGGDDVPGLAATNGKPTFCRNCPHMKSSEELMCYMHPSYSGPLPPFVHANEERRAGIEKAKEANSKKFGIPLIRLRAPSQKDIDEWKERKAQKAERWRNGGKPAGRVPGGAAVDVDAFMSGLQDLTDDTCGCCTDGTPDLVLTEADFGFDSTAFMAGEATDDTDQSALAMCWYVVDTTGLDGVSAVQCVADQEQLDLGPDRSALFCSFGTSEDNARAWAARAGMAEAAAAQTQPQAAAGQVALEHGASRGGVGYAPDALSPPPRFPAADAEPPRAPGAGGRMVANVAPTPRSLGVPSQPCDMASMASPGRPATSALAAGGQGAGTPRASFLADPELRPTALPRRGMSDTAIRALVDGPPPSKQAPAQPAGVSQPAQPPPSAGGPRANADQAGAAATASAALTDTSARPPLTYGGDAGASAMPAPPPAQQAPAQSHISLASSDVAAGDASLPSRRTGGGNAGADADTTTVDKSGDAPADTTDMNAISVYAFLAHRASTTLPALARIRANHIAALIGMLFALFTFCYVARRFDCAALVGCSSASLAYKWSEEGYKGVADSIAWGWAQLLSVNFHAMAIIVFLAILATTRAATPPHGSTAVSPVGESGPEWVVDVLPLPSPRSDIPATPGSAPPPHTRTTWVWRMKASSKVEKHRSLACGLPFAVNNTHCAQCGSAPPPPPSPPPSPPAPKQLPRGDLLSHAEAGQLYTEMLAGHEPPKGLPRSITHVICIVDWGCACTMGNHSDQFEPRSLYDRESNIAGASGAFKTSQRGTFRYPLQSTAGMRAWREPDAILNTSCPYVLLAIGKASIEHGVRFYMPEWGGDGYFEYPGGVRVTVYNRKVAVLRPLGYKDTPAKMLVAVTVEMLGVPSEGDYMVYVGSGERRDGDVATHLTQQSRGSVAAVLIDPKIGGANHNITRPDVAAAVVRAASDVRCLFILISIRCKTWSVANFMPDAHGNPGKPYRRDGAVLGIRLPDGSLPRAVEESNLETDCASAAVLACTGHGGSAIIETPVKRAPGQTLLPKHELADAVGHVYMFDHPRWAKIVERNDAVVVATDQCMSADAPPEQVPIKATALLGVGPVAPHVEEVFGPLQCNHPPRTHKPLRGVDSNGDYPSSKWETYSSTLCLRLVICFIRCSGNTFCGVAGVIRGKRLARHSVTGQFIHNTYGHSEGRTLKLLHHALDDVEPWWAQHVCDEACDVCLRANASRMGPSGALPDIEGLFFVDVYHTTIPAIFTGFRNVLGVTHARSGMRKTIRIKAKSDAPAAIDLCAAYFNSIGCPFRHLQCDGAHELKGSGVVPLARQRSWRITTTLPGHSRQNRMEPGWRANGAGTRTNLCQMRVPYEFWPYAWDDYEEWSCLRPHRSPPHHCPLQIAVGGAKQKGAHRRPCGCLCYPTVAPRWPSGTLHNKAAQQAPRALHLGYCGGASGSFEELTTGNDRTMPGYICYLPHEHKVIVTDSVSFVPDCFPGLQRLAGGGWTIPEARCPKLGSNETGEPLASSHAADSAGAGGEHTTEADMSTAGGIPSKPTMTDTVDTGGDKPMEPDKDHAPSAPRTDEQRRFRPYGANAEQPDAERRSIFRDLTDDDETTEMNGDGAVFEIRAGFAPEDTAPTSPHTEQSEPDPAEPPVDPAPARDPLDITGKRVRISWPKYGGFFPGECVGWRARADGGAEHHILYDNPDGKWQRRDVDRWHDMTKVTWEPESVAPIADPLATEVSDAEPPPPSTEPIHSTELTPNHETLPHEEDADPLREPTRPRRKTARYARADITAQYSVAALSAEHAALSGIGFDSRSQRIAGEAIYVDTVGRADLAACFALGLDMVAFSAEDHASAKDEYLALPVELQRCVCLAADHSLISEEFGHSSPQAVLARELYAAANLSAACAGMEAPPLSPLPYNPLTHDEVDSIDAMFDRSLESVGMLALDVGSVDRDLAYVSKPSSPDIYTERQMKGPEWDEAKQVEHAKLKRLRAFREVCADDPSIAGMRAVDCMWAGRDKRGADGEICKRSARCVLRGDLHSKFYNVTPNEAYAPVARNASIMSVDAYATLKGFNLCSFDVTGAYLQGKQRPCEQVLARPPVGFRPVDERGVAILWLMESPLYGQTDAGAIWNRTMNDFMTSPPPDGLGYSRCPHEPCVYTKDVDTDHARLMPWYVDDGRLYYRDTPAGEKHAQEDKAALEKRFEMRFNEANPKEDYFLSGNRRAESDGVCSVKATAYITQLAERYLDSSVTYPGAWGDTPASEELVRAYEHAVATRPVPDADLKKQYGSLFGALLHVVKFRPEVSTALGLCGTCLTICTPDMMKCLVRILVYLARTVALGTFFSKHTPEASVLRAFADSDWATTRSTTGFVIMLAGGAIAHASRRQHCISLSSCEAELVALAECAVELLYIRGLLESLGYDVTAATECFTDNKGAYDLCHRFASAQNSRHIDRKMFKMREMRGAGLVKVSMVVGETNPADLFTKILGKQLFEKHRRFILNLAARG